MTTFNDPKLFNQWLRRNNNLLRSYSPDQVAIMARMCGFTLDLVCRDVSDWTTHITRLLRFWESPFSENWLDVTAYDRSGRTWSDNEHD